MSSIRHITLPKGFRASGVTCGIKKSGRPDVAIIAADTDASAAIVTTSNQVVGAPIVWCRRVLPRGYGRMRGMVINSGNSNVCTGRAGLKDAETMAAATAKTLDSQAEKIIVASTGIIGHRLPMKNIRAGIAAAADSLGRRNDASVVQAIMTTDLRAKSAVVQGTIAGKTVTVGGIVKGSGMIAPSMATMIAVVTTDARVAPGLLHKALKEAIGGSFNAITVDSDTSTSDTVAVLASGAAGNAAIGSGSKEYRKFASMLKEVCGELARAVVADGEGATKLVRVAVRGARTNSEAKAAALSVANSPLFKCAIHGCDPNWGRILMALGKSAAKVDQDCVAVKIGPTTVFSRGAGRKFDEASLSEYLAGDEVDVTCNLSVGKGEFTALTCDLSREYIAINSDYST